MEKKSNLKNNLKTFFSGKYSKRFLICYYMPLIYTQLAIFFLFAISNYDSYDLIHMDISFLGIPNRNPSGWYLWAIGMMITGLMAFPVLLYVLPRINHLNKTLAKIETLLLLGFAVGMIGLGIFPQNDQFSNLHPINTILAFGGLYLAMLLMVSYFILNFKKVNKIFTVSPYSLVIMLLLEIIPPIGLVISQSIRYSQGINIFTDRTCIGDSVCPWYMSLSFWEWMSFFGVLLNLLIFLVILPEYISKKEKNN